MAIVSVRRRGRGLGVLGGLLVGLGLVAGAGLVAPGAASAQVRMNVGAGGFGRTSAVTSRELDKWAQMLAMTPEQKDAAKTLHTAYLEEHRTQTKAMEDLVKSAQQEFMESRDMTAFKEVGEKAKVISERIQDLDKGLMDDVKALLDKKQAEEWPRVERHHRRVKSLPEGMLAGETANLVTVVEDLKLAEQPKELKDAIEAYELDLDKALADRDVKRKEFEKKGEEMSKDFDFSKMDFTKIREMMQDVRKSGIPVRDINQRHARLIAAAVPADKKPEFEDRARKALYPRIYREPYIFKAISAAMGFDDLTADQKTQVSQIKESYARDVAPLNARWAAAIDEEEKDGGGDPFMGFGKMMPGMGGGEKSPTEDPEKARRDLDKATLERLKAALSKEQVDRLPEREMDNPWMPNLGGGEDDAADDKPAKPARERRSK